MLQNLKLFQCFIATPKFQILEHLGFGFQIRDTQPLMRIYAWSLCSSSYLLLPYKKHYFDVFLRAFVIACTNGIYDALRARICWITQHLSSKFKALAQCLSIKCKALCCIYSMTGKKDIDLFGYLVSLYNSLTLLLLSLLLLCIPGYLGTCYTAEGTLELLILLPLLPRAWPTDWTSLYPVYMVFGIKTR